MYIVTSVIRNSREPYFSAVIVNGRLITIVQNSNVSSELNLDHIKLFLDKIQKYFVDELPDLTEFAKTNIAIMPAKEKITSENSIIELDL